MPPRVCTSEVGQREPRLEQGLRTPRFLRRLFVGKADATHEMQRRVSESREVETVFGVIRSSYRGPREQCASWSSLSS